MRSTGYYINFSTKLLKHQKQLARALKNTQVDCDFFKVVKRLRVVDNRTIIKTGQEGENHTGTELHSMLIGYNNSNRGVSTGPKIDLSDTLPMKRNSA
mgnify:FL=1